MLCGPASLYVFSHISLCLGVNDVRLQRLQAFVSCKDLLLVCGRIMIFTSGDRWLSTVIMLFVILSEIHGLLCKFQ